jgi:hypothetical protein
MKQAASPGGFGESTRVVRIGEAGRDPEIRWWYMAATSAATMLVKVIGQSVCRPRGQ